MQPSQSGIYRPSSPWTRRILLIASGLVFLAGVPLFILSEQTDAYFAWTINPNLTAAFLGAGYWGSFLLEFLASREGTWAKARTAVPAIFLFTVLTLVATLLHLDRFHLNSPLLTARAAAWFWVAVYAIVPPALILALFQQIRTPGRDPPRQAPMALWMHVLLAIQSGSMIGIGAALFAAPLFVAPIWPWKLTALTGRAIGAWLLGIGVFAAHMSLENDFARVRAAMMSYTALGALELIALVRFLGDADLASAGFWVYLLLLVSVLTVGAYGWRAHRVSKAI
jgi:hypothetical protein